VIREIEQKTYLIRFAKNFLLLAVIIQLGCRSADTQVTKPLAPLLKPETILQDRLEIIRIKGWSHLTELVIKSGVDKQAAIYAFSSPHMPTREFLVFSLKPKEKRSSYKAHNTRTKKLNAFGFYLENKETFVKAAKLYAVPASVVLAILQVETSCGKYTGGKNVFPAIARLTNAGEPDNLRKNLQANSVNLSDAVYRRAIYLETTFLPHLIATFKLAPKSEVHLLRGSFAGAIGIPQFMPDNILKYGVDGNHDGSVDLYSPTDAIFSTANYLKFHGWNSYKLANAKKRAVIWEYNHSVPYIDTVLAMADVLQKMIDSDLGVKSISNDNPKKPSGKPARAAKSVHRGNKKSPGVLPKR